MILAYQFVYFTNIHIWQESHIGAAGRRVPGDVVPAVHHEAGAAPAPPHAHRVPAAARPHRPRREYPPGTFNVKALYYRTDSENMSELSFLWEFIR